MIEVDLMILEIGLIISITILVFLYSLISSDLVVTIICISLYFIFLGPLIIILERFRLIVINIPILFDLYKIIFYACFSIFILVGLILLIQLIYLVIFS